MPEKVPKKIRSVNIHYRSTIHGFWFFDKDGALLWKIGWIESWFDHKIVMLEENEVIVGVVAKLYPDCQSKYTDL